MASDPDLLRQIKERLPLWISSDRVPKKRRFRPVAGFAASGPLELIALGVGGLLVNTVLTVSFKAPSLSLALDIFGAVATAYTVRTSVLAFSAARESWRESGAQGAFWIERVRSASQRALTTGLRANLLYTREALVIPIGVLSLASILPNKLDARATRSFVERAHLCETQQQPRPYAAQWKGRLHLRGLKLTHALASWSSPIEKRMDQLSEWFLDADSRARLDLDRVLCERDLWRQARYQFHENRPVNVANLFRVRPFNPLWPMPLVLVSEKGKRSVVSEGPLSEALAFNLSQEHAWAPQEQLRQAAELLPILRSAEDVITLQRELLVPNATQTASPPAARQETLCALEASREGVAPPPERTATVSTRAPSSAILIGKPHENEEAALLLSSPTLPPRKNKTRRL